jgi:hypothetical protein
MSARLIFVVAAAAAAIGAAVVAGLIVAVVGLSAKMPTATLITITAEAAAAIFGSVIALSGITAALFFKPPAPPAPNMGNSAASRAGRDGKGGRALPRSDAACDSGLRAALKARAMVLEATHAHATELINSGVSIEAVRRRLGHASTETTQLYALLGCR